MNKTKSVIYGKLALMIISLVAILYNSTIYIFATQYIVAKGYSHALLEKVAHIPNSPTTVYITSIGLYALMILIIYFRDHRDDRKSSIFDAFSMIEIVLMFSVIVSLQFSYNGLILLVFADLFYSSREFKTSRGKRYWIALIIFSFTVLLLSNYDILSLFVDLPSLDTFISFYPKNTRVVILFLKNLLVSLNIVAFIISLLFYIMYSITERSHIEEELRMVSKVNTELNSYVALTEKIVEDRERKRIAREIHDTLGHALTGISAGIDAVKVLVDIDPPRAKEQLQTMSVVVREGIRDVRGSLNKLRPGALEDGSLREALAKMILEYEQVSHLKINLTYGWDKVDLGSTKENAIFRVIQESITNSLRHGHASQVDINLINGDRYIITIEDNGIGFEQLEYGYGLKQMRERIGVIGGHIHFENRDGFFTWIEIPKGIGEDYD